MVTYEGASQFGGLMILQYSTEDKCKQRCIDSPECAAVDFHKWETSCWMHQVANKTSHANSTCCNHYKKENVCQCKYGILENITDTYLFKEGY